MPALHVSFTACGASHGAVIPFEFWARFYHPNTRDQMLCRATLPLAKICSMITMNSPCQSVTLPLTATADQMKVSKTTVLGSPKAS